MAFSCQHDDIYSPPLALPSPLKIKHKKRRRRRKKLWWLTMAICVYPLLPELKKTLANCMWFKFANSLSVSVTVWTPGWPYFFTGVLRLPFVVYTTLNGVFLGKRWVSQKLFAHRKRSLFARYCKSVSSCTWLVPDCTKITKGVILVFNSFDLSNFVVSKPCCSWMNMFTLERSWEKGEEDMMTIH